LISPDRVPNPHMYEVGYYYQDIWTTPGDLSKGEIKVYNENFFRDLSAYYLEWEMLKGGKVVRSGRVDDLKVAPQQTSTIRLDLGETCQCTEWLLNVSYKLKTRRTYRSQGSADVESIQGSIYGIEKRGDNQYRNQGSSRTR
jgi:beta-galactosidase